jgi:S1-C subfamily serine protease
VLAKSPAAEAGLKIGDGIEQVEGKDVKTVTQLLSEAAKLTAGKTLRLSIRRDDKQQELKITAGSGL